MWLARLSTIYLIVCIITIQPHSSKQQNQHTWKTIDDASSTKKLNGFDSSNVEPVSQLRHVNEATVPSTIHLSGLSSVRMAEDVIDRILLSNREGRNLEGFDEIYADARVQNALELKNDTLARSYIRDKLCFLGLVNCDEAEERRPLYSPSRDIHLQEVIYAQPITIKPVGRPLPAIPVNKPVDFLESNVPASEQSSINSGSFTRDSLLSTSYFDFGEHPSFVSDSPSNFPGSYAGYKQLSINHSPKLVHGSEFQRELDYGDKFAEKKQVILEQGSSNNHQHVHHHYHHHNDGGANLVPATGSRLISSSNFDKYDYGNGGNPSNDFEEYKKSFKMKTPETNLPGTPSGFTNNNYADRYITYEKIKQTSPFRNPNIGHNLQTGKQFSSGNNKIYQNSFGHDHRYEPSNGFHSNINSISNNEFAQSDNGLLGTDYSDCVCVPYTQCTNLIQAGRKDDLYLAIDPRNTGKKIEADAEETVITADNGTMTMIPVLKENKDLKNLQYKKNENEEGILAEEISDSVGRKRAKRDIENPGEQDIGSQSRQFGRPPVCGPQHVCCRRSQLHQEKSRRGQCGVRYNQGIAGRIKTPTYIDGDSEFGEYPWQVAILKKEPGEKESVYVCGGTLISSRHIATAAHCIKMHSGRDLRARLGEWDVNHDVEFFPYIERDVISVIIHPEFYAGTLYNDIAILTLEFDVDFEKNPHISPACLPDKFDDFVNARCWTTGWGKDAFGDFGKYQNILKEVDVPIISNSICEHQMKKTRLGPNFKLHPGFICAGGEEGKDACKGDGGGPMVCERHGKWKLAGIVSWGIGCGQAGVPGVYTRISYYLNWILQTIGH